MCGITGFIGSVNSFDPLYNGICALLNRGYDSVGISTMNTDGNIITHKYASTDNESAEKKVLRHKSEHEDATNRNIGIAHCRWRTTGGKTDNNAHPHIDNMNLFSLVHNGIIENYRELYMFLYEKGYRFNSDTDTEIIVNLISYFYNINNRNTIIESIQHTKKQLKGTYALAIISKETPNKIYCVRKGSPLLIGYSDDTTNFMVSSEKYGFSKDITNYMCIDNDDIIEIERNSINNKCNYKSYSNILYKVNSLENLTENKTPHPYETWTLKEIYEQPLSIQRAIGNGGRIKNDYEVKLGGLEQNIDSLMEIDNIILLGCGSSLNAALICEHYFKELCDFNAVKTIDASIFTKYDIPKKGKTGLIFISQSGETYELTLCINIAKQENLIMIGVVNVVDSLIARETLCGVYLNSCREVSVCSTKAVTSQIVTLSLIAIWFSQNKQINMEKRKKYINDLRKLHVQTELLLNKMNISMFCYHKLLEMFEKKENCFVISQYQGVSYEGALKLKEMCYLMAEGELASGLKHGPFSILHNKFPIIFIDNQCEHHVKMSNIYNEIISRDAAVITISDIPNLSDIRENVISIPHNETYSNLLSIISLQFISYYLSNGRNSNVDFPRNIAKTITV
jgi:glucosamine--fructose-6-phosphate aminotransferase (isomerizing)